MKKEPYYHGTLRISNPKTLEKWIHNGNYRKELDDGYLFNVGCGRFKTEVCTCYKCRRPNAGIELKDVIKRHYKSNY